MPREARGDHARRVGRGFFVLFTLVAIEACVAAILLLQRRSEAGASILLGYSAPRLAAVFLAMTAAALSGWAAFAVRSGTRLRGQLLDLVSGWRKRFAAVSVLLVLAVLAWCAVFLPAGAFGNLGAQLDQLRPASALALLATVETLVFVAWEYQARAAANTGAIPRARGAAITAWALVCAGIAALWGFMAVTHIGLDGSGEDYWYGSGVPILAYGALLGLVVALLTTVIEQRVSQRLPRRTDLVVFALIWVASGLAWSATPATNGWFNPGDFPPTHETFPFSDAAKYDIASQGALAGNGFGSGAARTRPLYPAFLVIVHLLTGQDYEANIRLQAAVLGVFPALVYVLGTAMLSRSAGIAAAVLTSLRGMDSISATALLDLANAKVMLPDFPTALGIAAALILGASWIRSPGKIHYALLTGGTLALTVYLRPTALSILPVLLVAGWYALRGTRRSVVVAGVAAMLAGYAATALPWEVQRQLSGGARPYPAFVDKFLQTVFRRYGQEAPAASTPAAGNAGEPGALGPRSAPGGNWRDNGDAGERRGHTDEDLPPLQLDPLPLAAHFLHNLATTALILPASPALTDLGGTIGAASYTNWKWTGVLTGAQLIGLVASLAVAVAGMIAAAKRNTTVGLLPAAACLSYLLGNAFARTSGGRYIVPVDWIVLLYFVLGLAVLTRGLLVALGLGGGASTSIPRLAAARQDHRGSRKALTASAVGVLLAGSMLLVPHYAFRPAEQESEDEIASEVIAFLVGHREGVDADYLRQLMQERGHAYSGKILYPRSAAGDANGEFFFSTTTTRIPFPVLAFSLLDPTGDYDVRLAMPDSDRVRHSEEAIVIGCERSRALEAVVVMLLRAEPEIRFRDPLPPPTCPFVEPVCDQNGNCR